MRKITTMLMTAIVCGVMLTACGGGSLKGTYVSENGKETITFSGKKIKIEDSDGVQNGTFKYEEEGSNKGVILVNFNGREQEWDYVLEGDKLIFDSEDVYYKKDSKTAKDSSNNLEKTEEEVSSSAELPTLSPSDMFELGEKYYFDDKNYIEAAKWYRKSAEQGYAKAQYELGYMYYDGEGIEKDYSEALKWIRKSADQGNSDAQNALGDMHYLGDGVTENFSEAVKWYRKGAEQGNKYAQYNLGQMYEYGYGITQDYGKAIEWFQKAAKQGHEKAKDKLEYLLESGE
jgi:TPR repeat protein